MWEMELSLCYAMLSKNQKKAADILLEDPDAGHYHPDAAGCWI